MADMRRKLRKNGERHANHKLTTAAVKEIRAAAPFKRGQKAEFARRFGVGKTAITKVISGESWWHVQ